MIKRSRASGRGPLPDDSMTPAELAAQLGVDPRTVRRWLRTAWPRETTGTLWEVTDAQAAAAAEHWGTASVAEVLESDGTATRQSAVEALEGLADWSAWVPLVEVRLHAPRQPGVYLAREGIAGPLVYVGMASERRGQGLRGRLTFYLSGKAAVSGLGEAVMDRAVADAAWLRDRLAEVERGEVLRTKQWAALAVARFDLHVCWAVTPDRKAALDLERRALAALRSRELWNRRR